MTARDKRARVEAIFVERQEELATKTDVLFGYLFIFQWILGIIFALWISPRSWAGEVSQVHLHVYAAFFLGGLIASYPVYLVFTNPGAVYNRMVIAVSQMLFSILFIHLSGGRIETHFHVFGSLAFLAIYRDWRALVIATAITALDHLLRGALWPQSVYGVLTATPWRAFEHSAWVLFEDVVLLYSIHLSLHELWTTSESLAGVEEKEQMAGFERNRTQLLLDIAVVANQSESPHVTMKKTIDRICGYLNWPLGHAHLLSDDGQFLLPTNLWCVSGTTTFQAFRNKSHKLSFAKGQGLPGLVWQAREPLWIEDFSQHRGTLRTEVAVEVGLRTAFAFPIFCYGEVAAVLEFFTDEAVGMNEDVMQAVGFAAHQVGALFERKRSSDELEHALGEVAILNESLEQKVLDRTKQLEESQQRILEQQQVLVTTSKLSALGEMAGGVAHEINTPLAVIGLRVEQLEECICEGDIDPPEMIESLSVVKKTVDRIAKIVSGLRFFAREGRRALPQKVKLSILMEETLSLCQERFASHGILLEVSQNEAYHGVFVECRTVEISQVLLNLLNNAFDAISELSDKWIKIDFTQVEQTLEIWVTDSGAGIPPEVQDKMMQPFFTTKEIGKGTGLGLSISKGIMEEHHGRLYVDNECVNTRFILSMPLDQAHIEEKVA